MSRPVTFVWQPADTAYICAVQPVAGPRNLLLNGTVYQQAQAKGLSIVAVPFEDVARDVSITSDDNLSGVNFTITGTLNGVTISETIAGPVADTVYTEQLFDAVTNVSVDGPVNEPGVSIGSGLLGRTKYFMYNYQCTFPMLMINVFAKDVDAEQFSYSFGFTLDEVNGNLTPQHIFPTDILSDKTDSGYDYCEFPMRYAFIQINAGTDAANIITTFLQQGIK